MRRVGLYVGGDAAQCSVLLAGLVQTFTKISHSRVCRLRLTPQKLFFSTITEAVDADGVRVWSEVQQV